MQETIFTIMRWFLQKKDFLEGDTPGTDENQTGNESQNWFTDPANREMWQLTF